MRLLRTAAAGAVLLLGSMSRAMPDALPSPPDLDAARVEAWVDAQVQPAMRLSGVPGVVVVIVRKDRTLLSKGYGLADVERATPMRADATLLDIASIGKSMTAIIASQLIEELVLDLDEDVNRYLKSAHVTGPKVTLRMLLGHRGAFDADLTGLFVAVDGDTRMVPAELNRRLRPVAAPGWVAAYDNQGYGVIGLMLRDVTGKPLADLYRERIFDPSGMSTAVQGRPADGETRLARCYVVRGADSVSRCNYWLYRDGLRGAGGVAAFTELLEQCVIGGDESRFLGLAQSLQLDFTTDRGQFIGPLFLMDQNDRSSLGRPLGSPALIVNLNTMRHVLRVADVVAAIGVAQDVDERMDWLVHERPLEVRGPSMRSSKSLTQGIRLAGRIGRAASRMEAEGVEPSSRGRLIIASTCVGRILSSSRETFAT